MSSSAAPAASDMNTTAAAASNMKTCGVCLSDLSESDPLVTTLTVPCSHSFHRACIATGGAAPPICRHCNPFFTVDNNNPTTTFNFTGFGFNPHPPASNVLSFGFNPSTLGFNRHPPPGFGFGSNPNQIEPPTTPFDDDDPIPNTTDQPPAPSQPPAPPQTATITAFTEYPAVAASATPSSFAVLLKLRAPPSAPGGGDRAPVDLVAVLDVSGSMHGHKLALVKRAARFIVDALGPADRLSIVTFSTHARRRLPLSLMSPGGRARAAAVLDSLAAESSTNIKAGLRTGVRVLDDRRHKNPVAGLILLSDGEDTDNHVGDSYRNLLPVPAPPIHTFGFGADHDPTAMHAIADASGGTFSFIEAEEAIQDAFAMCIGGLLSVVAQGVEVMATAATPGVRISSVDSGSYPVKILSHGLAASVEVGDLYADEEKDFLFHVAVPDSGGAAATPLLSVTCSYKTPLTGEVEHVNGETAVVRRAEMLSPSDGEPDLVVDGQRNRILVAKSMKEAQGKAESGDVEGARAVLAARRAAVVESASAKAGDALCGWLDAEMREIERRMASVHVYQQSGRAYSLSGLNSHLQQRAASGAQAMQLQSFMQCTPTSSEGSGGVAFGGIQQQKQSMSGVVGYQTRAMRDMVERSQEHARLNQHDA